MKTGLNYFGIEDFKQAVFFDNGGNTNKKEPEELINEMSNVDFATALLKHINFTIDELYGE